MDRKGLRFIHRDFGNLPSQAIRASMCGIQPPEGKERFSKEANISLLQLVANKYLIGLVQNVDFKVNAFITLYK